MASGRLRPTNGMIAGIGLLLFAAVLAGFGMHHLIRTGTCSSTGYSANYGPVPYCPAGTGIWIGFLIGGIFAIVTGALIAGSPGLIISGIFCAIGAGAITVAFDKHASSGSSTFGVIFGGCFLVGGLIPLVFVLRGAFSGAASGRTPAVVSAPAPNDAFGGAHEKPDAILGAYTAGSRARPTSTPPSPRVAPGAGSSGDALEKIAKLSELHKSGALTDGEFEREKAKLLAEL